MTTLLTPTANGTTAAQPDASLRKQALEQLNKKRGFRTHLTAYLLVNGFLWLIWGTLLATGHGFWFPWPLFPLAGWGIGLVFHAWDTYGRKPFSDAEIERELDRLRRRAVS